MTYRIKNKCNKAYDMHNSKRLNHNKGAWESINWTHINTELFEWQVTIYELRIAGRIHQMHEIQNTLINSTSAKQLAVRRVTQDNKGKATAGIDGVCKLNTQQRFQMASNLQLDGQASPIKRVWIPKPGTRDKRPLGIPTMEDRARQALAKMALEPEWEAIFEQNSYGFRPGKNIHDALKQIKNCLILGYREIYDADIAKCFDRINHNYILDKLSQKTGSQLHTQLQSWLKANVLDRGNITSGDRGTPQGGVISPLLSNIALHGLGEQVNQAIKTSVLPNRAEIARKTHTIRYADDFIILTPTSESLQVAIKAVKEFLNAIGLEINKAKTRITNSKIGFDFLGCEIRQIFMGKHKVPKTQKNKVNWRVCILPNQKTVDKHFGQIRQVVKTTANREQLIKKLNAIIGGWVEFAKHTDASTYGKSSLWGNQLYRITKNWVYRRYNIKAKDPKIWTKVNNRDWILYGKEKDKLIYLATYDGKNQSYSVNKYIKVKSKKSPYDGDWIYWGTRNATNQHISSLRLYLLRKQRGLCKWCGHRFRPNDLWNVDHVTSKANKGTNKRSNLQLIHKECHEQKTAADFAHVQKAIH